MANSVLLDEKTNRKCFLDEPDDIQPDDKLVFILNLHGGGSHGTWQHRYFPAHDFANQYRLVVATPSAMTREPVARWVGEADDEHLQNLVEMAFERYGSKIKSFWLAGHSQGGMTANRLLNTDYFAERVDGWLSLSGSRIGAAPRARDAGRPPPPGSQPRQRMNLTRPPVPDCDFSFIFAVGEHEIEHLPEDSPWAEKYGAGPRVQMPDIVDTEPGQIFDQSCDGYSTKAWGLRPAPGTAQMWVYPDAKDGRVVADVVRLTKGHTEGLEPNVVEEIIRLMVQEPGGKAARFVRQG